MVRGVTLHTAARQARRAGRRSAHFQTGVSSCETGLTSDLTVVCKLAYCQAGGEGVGLEHYSETVCTIPVRAPQQALDLLTPGNGHTSTTQS